MKAEEGARRGGLWWWDVVTVLYDAVQMQQETWKKKDGTLDIVRPTLSKTEFLLVIEYSYSIW